MLRLLQIVRHSLVAGHVAGHGHGDVVVVWTAAIVVVTAPTDGDVVLHQCGQGTSLDGAAGEHLLDLLRHLVDLLVDDQQALL